MLKRLCYIFLLLIPGFQSAAQNWSLYTQQDGLPSNNLNDLFVDGPNRVWIASDSGLVYYDGQSFLTYNTVNSNLPSNNIKELEVVNGEVFLISDSGFSTYNGRTFTNYNVQNGLLQNRINSMAVDTSGNIWLAANAGVSKFNGITFSHDSGRAAKDIVVDDSNRVYILRYTVVFNIPTAGLTVYEMFDGQSWSSPPMGYFADYYRSQFYKSSNGKIFLMPSGGGNQFYAELHYPFNLRKRPINTESTVNRTPRFMKEINGERWMNYWGVTSVYRSLAKDSTYLPMYLTPVNVNVKEMDTDNSNIYISTDQGLLVGPATYETPRFRKVLDINTIDAGVNINGALFHNYTSGRASFGYPADSNLHLIYAANMQLGIKRDSSQGTFKIFPEEIIDQSYVGGPYHTTNQFFGDQFSMKINRVDIDNHRLSYNQSGYQIPESILNWPAVSDSTYFSSTDLAPFEDLNNNGCYDPYQGEYPLIKGDQAIYWINHPVDKSIPLEYHWMLYGFNRPMDSTLNQSVFLQLRIINRDSLPFNYIKPAFRVDADLGFPNDDFNGSDSLRDMIYFYNGDNFDDDWLASARGYRGNPPALGIRSLSAPATSATFYQTAISYAFSDSWNYLHGMNGDSTYFINPHTGLQTRYQFSGDPFSLQGWTEANLLPNRPLGNNPGERKGTLGLEAFSLAPGQSHTIELVVNVAQKTLRTAVAEYLPLLRTQMDALQNHYNNTLPIFPNYGQYFNCPLLVGLENIVQLDQKRILFYPNPSSGSVRIESSKPMVRIQLISLEGKIVLDQPSMNDLSEMLDLQHLRNGIYLLRVLNSEGWQQEKLILNK